MINAHHLLSLIDIHMCKHSKWYNLFCTVGCSIQKGIRYTGEDNSKLDDDARAKRFIKYLQVCCNLHRGHDVTYLVKHWFRHNECKKRDNKKVTSIFCANVCICTHKACTYKACTYSCQAPIKKRAREEKAGPESTPTIVKKSRQEKATPASTPAMIQFKQTHVETPPLASVEVKDVQVEDVEEEEWTRSVEQARKSVQAEQEWTRMVEEACKLVQDKEVPTNHDTHTYTVSQNIHTRTVLG